MSFLIDPPLLVGAGAMIERAVPPERRDLASASVVGTFVGVSVGLYLDVPGLGAIWRPFGSAGGRDFMLNSGVLGIDHTRAGAPTHAAAAAIFATYPLWLALGRRLARRRPGSAPAPGGPTDP
ncbi:MAG: hypothetical protein U5R31_07220 [Acidimicrobiia bacterium]|nr:hypothetical protein [Acidimicrobiia bacterium]